MRQKWWIWLRSCRTLPLSRCLAMKGKKGRTNTLNTSHFIKKEKKRKEIIGIWISNLAMIHFMSLSVYWMCMRANYWSQHWQLPGRPCWQALHEWFHTATLTFLQQLALRKYHLMNTSLAIGNEYQSKQKHLYDWSAIYQSIVRQDKIKTF